MLNCTCGEIAAFAEDYGYDYGFSQDLSAIIDKFVEKKGDCAVTE